MAQGFLSFLIKFPEMHTGLVGCLPAGASNSWANPPSIEGVVVVGFHSDPVHKLAWKWLFFKKL